MGFGPFDAEIAGGGALRHQFGAHARIVGAQALDRQARPETGHFGMEQLRPGRVDAVVEGRAGVIGEPFGVRAELAAPGHVDGQMQAEAGAGRHRIDQPREGRVALDREIAALHIMRLGQAGGVRAVDGGRNLDGMVAAGVDDRAGAYGGGRGAAGLQPDMAGLDRARMQRRAKGDGAAGILKLALQGEEVGVAVKDAGDRRDNGAGDTRAQGRFDLAHRGPVDDAELLDAIGLRPVDDALQAARLVADGHHELAAALHRDTVRIEISVKHSPAVHTVARLQAALGVIEPRMDHLGIARGGMHRDLVFGFQHDHFAARPGEGAGRRKADHAGADDDHICLETVRHEVPAADPFNLPLAGEA